MSDNEIISPMAKPFIKPSVGASYKHGWHQLWKYFLELFLIFIVFAVISIPAGMGSWSKDIVAAVGFFTFVSIAYNYLIMNPVSFGTFYAYLKAARGDDVDIKDMFAGFQNYWNTVLAALLVSAIIIIGLVLIIVPGIVFACKLAFTPYLVIDKKMEVIPAIKKSWSMTNGYAWKVFWLGLLGLLIVIAGLICLGVGVIISIMWINLALGTLYQSVSVKTEAGLLEDKAV